jgi:hypothetical protein
MVIAFRVDSEVIPGCQGDRERHPPVSLPSATDLGIEEQQVVFEAVPVSVIEIHIAKIKSILLKSSQPAESGLPRVISPIAFLGVKIDVGPFVLRLRLDMKFHHTFIECQLVGILIRGMINPLLLGIADIGLKQDFCLGRSLPARGWRLKGNRRDSWTFRITLCTKLTRTTPDRLWFAEIHNDSIRR